MKILLLGPGSIGARHLRNIISLGYNDVSVVSRSGKLSPEFSRLSVYTSVASAVANGTYDAAVICTPTAMHTADLKAVLQAKVPRIYLEKPVSHSMEHINEIIALCSSCSQQVFVGFDLHFDPGMQKVQQLLQEREIGDVVSVNAFVGQYLPDWRPHEDYTKGMSARKQTGGGVMLDLVHEFDYLLWLIGKVNSITCHYRNSGSLQIETEDVADVLIRFDNGVTGTLHLDYLQRNLVRFCIVTGTKGTIRWDLAGSIVSWTNDQKKDNGFTYESFQRNDRFVEIMKAFLQQPDDKRLTSLEQGIESLQMVLAAKRSSEENRTILIQHKEKELA